LPLSLHSFSLPFLDWVRSLSFYLKNGVSLILFFQVSSLPLSGTEGSELCIRVDSSFTCESPMCPGVDLELFGRGGGGFEEHPEPQSLEQSTGKFERVGEELEETQIPRIGWSKKGVSSALSTVGN
ncbi:unnamed protein product, partial [Linum tenue]